MDNPIIEHTIPSSDVTVAANETAHLIHIHTKDTGEPVKRTVSVGANGIARIFTVLLDSVDIEIVGDITGDHAAFEHFVLYFGAEKQRIRIRTNTEHHGKNTLSRTVVHGVATQNAHIDFAGSINIHQTGKHTDAHLEHEGLLFSRKARINALPGFEIATDDVKAIHSSAVHYIRPEQLFYLQSRGLEESVARQMIVSGFVEAMLMYIDGTSAYDEVEQLMQNKYHLLENAV